MTTVSSSSLVRLLLGTPTKRGEEPEARDRGTGFDAGLVKRQVASPPISRPRRGRRPDDMSGGKGKQPAKRRVLLSALLPPPSAASPLARRWTVEEAVGVVRRHPLPCIFALCLLFFMGVEYTLTMVPSDAPPFDLGFILTRPLQRLLANRPVLNSAFAALNTVFVAMQSAYILWTLLVEGRPRATIAALFMFTCRGILGYSTQLSLPQEFLGSGADFPVGNVSFFLFFSGHVAGALIASLDMRRTGRRGMAALFDGLNLLQGLRLLATRGHYTIDLGAGVGAGLLFDGLAGKYEERSRAAAATAGDEELQRRAAARRCRPCACHG